MILHGAFAQGISAGVFNIGPLPGLVQSPESGCTFEPATAESLLNTVRNA